MRSAGSAGPTHDDSRRGRQRLADHAAALSSARELRQRGVVGVALESEGDVTSWTATGASVSLTPADAEWPNRLGALCDAGALHDRGSEPVGLWVRGEGDLRQVAANSVAVVGSRAATSYGMEQASDLSRQLTSMGQTIVSGLAFGVDQAAHRGALAAGGSTIAVMPSESIAAIRPRTRSCSRPSRSAAWSSPRPARNCSHPDSIRAIPGGVSRSARPWGSGAVLLHMAGCVTRCKGAVAAGVILPLSRLVIHLSERAERHDRMARSACNLWQGSPRGAPQATPESCRRRPDSLSTDGGGVTMSRVAAAADELRRPGA